MILDWGPTGAPRSRIDGRRGISLHQCQDTVAMTAAGYTMSVNSNTAYTAPGRARSVKLVTATAAALNGVTIDIPDIKMQGQICALIYANGITDSYPTELYGVGSGVPFTGRITICTGGVANCHYWSQTMRNGWNLLIAIPGQHSNTTGTGAVFSDIDKIAIQFYTNGASPYNGAAEFYLCDVFMGRKLDSAIALRFDDEILEFYTDVLPLVEAQGWVASIAHTQAFTSASFMTDAQVLAATKRVVNGKNHEVNNHSKLHENDFSVTGSYSQTYIAASYANQRDNIASKWGGRGNEAIGVYPYGAYGGYTIPAMQAAGMICGWSTLRGEANVNQPYSPPEMLSLNPYSLTGFNPNTGADVTASIAHATMLGYVDNMMAASGCGAWIGHGGNSTGGALSYYETPAQSATANYTDFLAGLKLREARGLKVGRLSDVMNLAVHPSEVPAPRYSISDIPSWMKAMIYDIQNNASYTDTGGTTAAVAGDQVLRVADSSGRGYNAYSTSTYGPKLASATNNGRTFKYLRFDSRARAMWYAADGTPGTVASWPAGLTSSYPTTIIAVCRMNSHTENSNHFIVDLRDAAGATGGVLYKRNVAGAANDTFSIYNGSSPIAMDGTAITPDAMAATDEWFIFACVLPGTAGAASGAVSVNGQLRWGEAGTNAPQRLMIGNAWNAFAGAGSPANMSWGDTGDTGNGIAWLGLFQTDLIRGGAWFEGLIRSLAYDYGVSLGW